jgi:hypothetical protein
MSAYVCDHCGRVAGDDAGGYSSLHDATGSYRFCHPPTSDRPDCYRLITEEGEVIGIRRRGPVSLAIDAVAGLTNWIGRLEPCPTCPAIPPAPCFPDGTVHPRRIAAAEERESDT